MKKNKIAILVLGLFVFCLIGIGKVNATTNSFQVVCAPEALEIGQKSKCYIIANLNNNDAIYGVYSRAVTKDLTVKTVGTNQTGVDAGLISAGQKSGKGSNGLFTCDPTLELKNAAGKTVKELGYKDEKKCAYFESSTTEPKIVKGYKSTTISSKVSAMGTGYTEVGYYEVELDSTATANDCGTLCVEIWYLEKYSAATTSIPKSTGNESQKKTYFPASTVCGEVTTIVKPKENTDTGNFASYTVLIAGACIAIAAIAIASKNNKLYKV